MFLVLTGRSLVLQEWDDLYIAYQPSSAETHVFNEATVSILRGLEYSSLSLEALKEWTEADLGLDHGRQATSDFAFATARLEELGLIECLDDTIAVQ